MKQSYLKTIYNEGRIPKTNYPYQLGHYLVSRFKMEGLLVDVGCGRGDFMRGFKSAGMKVNGVDYEMTEDKHLEKYIFCGINLETDNLPFEDNSVDVVFMKSVLEHIHNPDKMMNECYRILKPGGRIIAMVPDWHTCMYIYYDDHTHVQPYTATGLRDCLRMFGFRNITSEQFYQLPVVWNHPEVKIICKLLQFLGPVKKVHKNKFYRFSRELILLASGTK